MRYAAPKGTYDLIPPQAEEYRLIRQALARPAQFAGFGYIETPTFEDTALFLRGVGESTDIVNKEMYTFTDKGDRSITLRPEMTAPVVRAVLEHGLDRGQLPVKLWYSGSCYRYERPQAGRFRQFNQVGLESIGSDDPAVDAEAIMLAIAGFAEVGLSRVETQINTIGCSACRPVYRAALVEYLSTLELDDDTARRAELNPLRVLDDKRPEMQAAVEAAPKILDYICDDCRDHFATVQTLLTAAGVEYTHAPRLVRGFDYYTKTTFEFVHPGLGAQSAVGGGGRYDGLSTELGGQPLPSVGWAIGLERTALAAESEGVSLATPGRCDVFVVPMGEPARRAVFSLVAELRQAGIRTDQVFGSRGVKGSMKAADRSGAAWAVIVGDAELADGTVQLKNLLSGEQHHVARADLVAELQAG